MTDEQIEKLLAELREVFVVYDSVHGANDKSDATYQAICRIVRAAGKWSYRARCLRLGFYEHLPLKDLFGFLKEIKKFDPSREDE